MHRLVNQCLSIPRIYSQVAVKKLLTYRDIVGVVVIVGESDRGVRRRQPVANSHSGEWRQERALVDQSDQALFSPGQKAIIIAIRKQAHSSKPSRNRSW